MNGTRLGCYDFVNRHVRSDRKAGEDYFFLKNMAVGATVGAFGAFLGNPFFLVKVRLQVANRVAQQATAASGSSPAAGSAVSAPRVVGVQYNYKGVMDGLSQVVKNEGFLGLFRNAHVPMTRVAMGSSAQLSSYDSIKHWISTSDAFPRVLREGSPLHFTSSMIAAAGVACVMNPADVMRCARDYMLGCLSVGVNDSVLDSSSWQNMSMLTLTS